MDQLYFLDGYYEGKYFVYTADAIVGFTPYIADNYLNQGFFEDRSSIFTLAAELTRQAFQQGQADFASAFTTNAVIGLRQSAVIDISAVFNITATVVKTARVDTALTSSLSMATVSVKTARSSQTLTTIANLAAQAARTRLLTSSITATASQTAIAHITTRTASNLSTAFTQTALAERFRTITESLNSLATQTTQTQKTAVGSAIWTSAFAPTVTAVASVSNGSNITATATLTVLTGVIRELRIGSAIGVDADTEASATRSPFLRFGTNNTATPLDGFVSVSDSVNQTGKFVMSMWMVKPLGFVFDADPNRDVYTSSSTSQWNNNAIEVETDLGAPSFYYHGNTGFVKWSIGPSPRLETLKDYSHYLLSVDITKSTNAEKYRLFKDGVEITGRQVYQTSGVGAGQTNTLRTDPYDIKITAFDQYQLMMNTTGGSLKRVPRGPNGGGYGDSNNVKADRGGLTQFWWDYDAASYDIDNAAYRAKFYDGNYRDLGDQGTATGLARPKHYVRLLNFQDIEEGGTKRSVQAQWQWLNLVLDSSAGSNPVIDFYTETAYTATTDQNSTGLLGGIRSSFVLSGDSVTVLETTSNPQAVFTASATATRIQTGLAALTSTATVNAVVAKIVGISSALSITASITVISQRVRYADTALASAATVTATVFRVKQFALAVNSLATQTVTAFRIQPATATVVAQFTLTGTIDNRNRDAVSLEVGAFTLTAAVGRTRTLASGITATCTFSIVYQVIRPAGSAMTASFTQIATPDKRIISFGNFTAQFSVTSTVFRVAIASANLSANGFQLTQGDILNFDPCREIAVEEETRLARILPENRLVIVEQETRALRVPQETRVLKVDFETRVNITQC